jgi:hypothetical protein
MTPDNAHQPPLSPEAKKYSTRRDFLLQVCVAIPEGATNCLLNSVSARSRRPDGHNNVKLWETTAGHPIPKSSASWFYTFGSMTLLCFVIQVVTG